MNGHLSTILLKIPYDGSKQSIFFKIVSLITVISHVLCYNADAFEDQLRYMVSNKLYGYK